jgi:hypothetical protein
MKALIDGDVLLYNFGAACDDEGSPLKWPFVQQRLEAKINSIVIGAGAETYEIHISGSNNFRVKEATIKPYKGNRNLPKPHWHAKVKEYFLTSKKHTVIVAEGMEADDTLSIAQLKDPEELTIICSPDKDLKMVPGWHYRWSTHTITEIKPFFVSPEEAINWFYMQLLMGDPTDNIPGLYLVGPVKAKGILHGLTTPQEMFEAVQREYENRFGSYWKQFMYENARLLWMMTTPTDDIRTTLDEYDRVRQSNQYV